MPKYIYTAKSRPDKIIQASIEAESETDAINKLSRMGIFPVSVKADTLLSQKQSALRFFKVSSKEVALFTRQLSSLFESGVNILNSLNIIVNQTPNKYLKAVINDVYAKIKDGKSLSESLISHPKLFSNFYTSMIHSGEMGGNIVQILKRLADFLEKEEEFKNSLRSALIYPAFIFSVSGITVAILMGFVIPRLVTMFEDMGQMLPLPTKILITISGFLRSFWPVLAAAIFIAAFLLKRFHNTPKGRFFLDGFKLKSAIFGSIILKTQISRMMRTMSLLLSGGIPIVTALDIAISVLENQVLKLEAEKFKQLISGGASFSSCLKNSRFFPSFVTSIVTVGEESGALEKSLLRIADDYEKEIDRSLKELTRLLEPVIILGMGIVVGFIVLAMLLPIFQINLIVK